MHLRDSQNKQEHSNLPSLGDPRVLDRGQTMAKVVVIINGVTITVPVKGAGVPKRRTTSFPPSVHLRTASLHVSYAANGPLDAITLIT